MTSQEAIEYLSRLKDDIRNTEKFNGQAKIMRDIGKDIKLLSTYKFTCNEPGLFVKKWDEAMKNVGAPSAR